MKKFIKGMTVGCLLPCLALSMVGCGGGGEPQTNNDYSEAIKNVTVDNESTLSGTLDIYAVDMGYGITMFEALELGFEKKYPNVEVNLKTNTLKEKVTQENYLEPAHMKYDIFFNTNGTDILTKLDTSPIAGYPIMFAELDSVYEAVPKGESVAIKDKLLDGIMEQHKYSDGHYYTMDWASGLGALYYNVDMFTEKGYEVPVTSDDLLNLCKEIKADVLTPFIVSETEYWHQMFYTFWAQYQGIDEYENYHNGIDSATGKISNNVVNQAGRLRGLEAIEEYLDYGTGFTSADSQNQTTMANQSDFFKGGSAMYYTGSWLENEMSQLYPNGANVTLDVMPELICSAVSENMSYYADGTADFYSLTEAKRAEYDAKLKELVAYVKGGKTATVPSFASDDDIAYVEEIVKYRGLLLGHVANIPAYAKDVELAKAFLVFMYSDEGIEVYSKAGTPSILPVKNTVIVNDTDTRAEKTIKTQYSAGFTAIMQIQTTKLCYAGGFSALGDYVTLEAQFGKHNAADRLTAKQIFDNLSAYYKTDSVWNNILQNAGYLD